METKRFKWMAVLLLLVSPTVFAAFPIASAGTEGQKVVVGQTGEIVATYQGNSAWNNNTLFLMLDAFGNPGDDGNLANDLMIFNNKDSAVGTAVSLGTFNAGTELMFRLNTVLWSDPRNIRNFYTGEASRNADNHTHARVEADWKPGETLVSFEDLYGGLYNYNDMSFSFTNTFAAPVPEESTLVLSLAGLSLIGWMRRRKK